jgi:hypothetical protein
MDQIELKDLFALIFERANAMQSLWDYYNTVVLGIIGFIAAARVACQLIRVRVLLTFVFAAFAIANLTAMSQVHRQREVLVEIAIPKISPQSLENAKLNFIMDRTIFSPPPVYWIWLSHIILDLFVIGAIWVFPALNRMANNQPDHEM